MTNEKKDFTKKVTLADLEQIEKKEAQDDGGRLLDGPSPRASASSHDGDSPKKDGARRDDGDSPKKDGARRDDAEGADDGRLLDD